MGGSIPLTDAVLQAAVKAVRACSGNKQEAAEMLDVPRSTLCHRLKIAFRELKLKPEIRGKQDPLDGKSAEHLRIERLESDVRGYQLEIKNLTKQVISAEHIKNLIHDGKSLPKPPKWRWPKPQPNLTGVPILLASDWHWAEVVEPSQVNGVNAFNMDIAHRRCELLFQKTEALLLYHMAKPKYDYMVIQLGGDMISGNIHEELRETNAMPVSLAIMDVLDYLVAGITRMHDKFGRLYIPCVVGNHGRWDRKPRAKGRAYESFEFFLYHLLARHFRAEKSIFFDIADGPDLPFKVYNTKYLLTHGDQARGGSGISGAMAPLMLLDHRKRKRAMATSMPYDLLVMGHWHQYLHMKGMIINGALKGYDEYALQQNFDFELPTQALWVTHPDHHITAKWPIYLENEGAKFK